MSGNPLDFSFSGIKTAVLRWTQSNDVKAEIEARRHLVSPDLDQLLAYTPQATRDLVASFQYTVVEELLRRCVIASELIAAQSVIVAGGVACNTGFQAAAQDRGGLRYFFPTRDLATDNAAMIAAAAYPKLLNRDFAGFDLRVKAQLNPRRLNWIQHGNPRTSAQPPKLPIPGVENIIAVGSGKGGVGKSTVAVNLAIALANLGYAVGLMDADVYGPNVPLMMGIKATPQAIGQRISPRSPWRPPHVHGPPESRRQAAGLARTHAQFRHPAVPPQRRLGQTRLSVIDLPPGTGDVQLTLIQTTPSNRRHRCHHALRRLAGRRPQSHQHVRASREPVLGIVENMSYLEHNGEKLYIFGKGGGAQTARRMRVPLLAEFPLDPETREGGDAGKPIATVAGHKQAELFIALAKTIIERAEELKKKERPPLPISD